MARNLIIVVLALIAVAATAVQATGGLFGGDYCDDSAFDPKMIRATDFYRQKGLFASAFAQFRSWTREANLTSNSELQAVADQLAGLAATYAAEFDAATQGFTITRSSGIIIIDTASAPTMVNPNLENHNTRYEYAKAIQCRDHGAPVVFEKYDPHSPPHTRHNTTHCALHRTRTRRVRRLMFGNVQVLHSAPSEHAALLRQGHPDRHRRDLVCVPHQLL
jgi:hypothetical protein